MATWECGPPLHVAGTSPEWVIIYCVKLALFGIHCHRSRWSVTDFQQDRLTNRSTIIWHTIMSIYNVFTSNYSRSKMCNICPPINNFSQVVNRGISLTMDRQFNNEVNAKIWNIKVVVMKGFLRDKANWRASTTMQYAPKGKMGGQSTAKLWWKLSWAVSNVKVEFSTMLTMKSVHCSQCRYE